MEEEAKEPEASIIRDGMTQQEIADAIGVTRQMVYLIEKRAMRKIRKQFEIRGWTFEECR